MLRGFDVYIADYVSSLQSEFLCRDKAYRYKTGNKGDLTIVPFHHFDYAIINTANSRRLGNSPVFKAPYAPNSSTPKDPWMETVCLTKARIYSSNGERGD